jgi:anti-anti-sigma factor
MTEQPLSTEATPGASATTARDRNDQRPANNAEPSPTEPRGTNVAPLAAFDVQLDRSERRICVGGELDMATVPVLARAMALLLDIDPVDSIVDLAGLTFIDAAGLGCLVRYAAQISARAGKTTLVGVTPRVARVFDIGGLRHLLEAS